MDVGAVKAPAALGHTVRLMPPAYVKPYVKLQKNDAADAEAICEAVTRANMRFLGDQDARAARRHSRPNNADGRLSDRKAELEQLTMNVRGTPKQVVNAHPPDQRPQIRGRPPRSTLSTTTNNGGHDASTRASRAG